MITRKRLKEVIRYNPITGIFLWVNPSKYHREKCNTRAGTIRSYINNKKYRWIGIDEKYYPEQRLAWLYTTGVQPLGHIDHRNGNTLDNRLYNLNCVDHYKNAQNHKVKIKKNELPSGVRSTASGKYQARIRVNNKKIHLGTFKTVKEAFGAYTAARRKYHYCPCAKGVIC